MDRLSSRCLKEMKDMKTNMKYLAAAAALVLAASCTREVIETNAASDPEAITLELICADPITKTAGTDLENQVTTMDYWFFKDMTAAPKFHYRETFSFTDKRKIDFIPGETYGEKEFPKRSELIGTDGTCVVFVAANLPSSVSVTANSLEDLQNTVVDQTFMTATTGSNGKPVYSSNRSATSFIMSGKVAVKGTRQKTTATSTAEVVQLQRLAAKLTANVNVIASKSFPGIVYEEAQDGQEAKTYTETWEPMLSGNNVRMYPQYVASKAALGASDGKHFLAEGQLDKVDYAPFIPTAWADNVKTGYKSVQNVGPYYLYPSDANGSSTSFKIIVPWKVTRTDEATGTVLYTAQREIYYKVMLPDSKVLANNWYQLTVDIDVIGTEGEPEVEIEGTYQVVDWTTGAAGKVNTQISDIKYLTVDRSLENSDGENEVTVNSAQVQFNASGAVEIDWAHSRIYYLDYSNGAETASEINILNNNKFNQSNGKGIADAAAVKAWFTQEGTVQVTNTYLVLNHPLVNDMTKTYFDSAPYYFKIRLMLTADNSVYKDIVFVQYPAIYVKNIPSLKNSQNQANIFVNGYTRATAYDDTYKNNNRTQQNYLGNVNIGNATTSNYNQYSVTVSVLGPENTITYGGNTYQMVIGDPRGAATTLSGLNNSAGYRPTSESKMNYVAPKFIVASSYGATSPTSYEGAQKRCAAYQENGYPAGRWRLPTAAEIQFIITLSEFNPKRIPALFSPDTHAYYWSAGHYAIGGSKTNGKWNVSYFNPSEYQWDYTADGTSFGYVVPNGTTYWGTIYEGVFTRCVYDEWYWGDNKYSGADAESWKGFHTGFINNN